MKKSIIIVLLLSIIAFVPMPLFAQDQNQTKTILNKNLDQLKIFVQDGKAALQNISNSNSPSSVKDSITQLQEIILAASERAKRICEWDINVVKTNAEQVFDTTINAVEEYLALVTDNGPVHQAALRIRAAAADQARNFREIAIIKGDDRYNTLAKAMDAQSAQVTIIWESIATERLNATEGLKKLKASKDYFIAVNIALGIEAAVKELTSVKDDLMKLTSSMDNVQKSVMSAYQ
jgi:phosphotransferase system IIB component